MSGQFKSQILKNTNILQDFIYQNQFYFMGLSETHKSKLQKKFMTTTVYKRSKQYFDINRLNKIEKEQQLSRRKPTVTEIDNLSLKFEQSFYNADIKLNERVQTQLSKCFTKTSKEDDSDETETNCTFNNRKGKTLDMSKMLSRNYYDKDAQSNKNQWRFCNFKPYNLPKNHTVDFQKFFVPSQVTHSKAKIKQCGRCKTRETQYQETSFISPPEIGKMKEKLRFDESLFKTLVDFKKNDKEKSQRGQEDVSPERHLDRIQVGEDLTKKTMQHGLIEFYHGNTKWVAPQMDNRLMKQNQYFLKQQNKLDQKKMDWTMVKRKTDLIQKRKKEIMGRKEIKDVKGQFCDQKFFRRNYL